VEAETEADRVTIVLADDHELVRAGIRKVLEDEPGFEVVAEAGDAETAARYVLGHKPSVLVLDLSMPGMPSLEALPKVFANSPDTSVVVLTMQNEPAFARKALQGGAKGYVIKHSAASELVTAIRAVIGGGTYINPELGARLAAEPEDKLPETTPLADSALPEPRREEQLTHLDKASLEHALLEHGASVWVFRLAFKERVRPAEGIAARASSLRLVSRSDAPLGERDSYPATCVAAGHALSCSLKEGDAAFALDPPLTAADVLFVRLAGDGFAFETQARVVD